MTLLIIDDEKDMKTLFEQKFRKNIRSGTIEILFAENGQSAMEIILSKRQNPADFVILVDYNLPDISGSDLVSQIKDINNQYKVFVVTGMADDATRSACLKNNCDGFFSKPIDFNLLIDSLKF